MKNKQNIAMLCNKEQFEAIKPKLEKSKIEIKNISGNFGRYCYLVNNYMGKRSVSNVSVLWIDEFNRIVHEQWNEKLFLEACGIETTPTLEEVKEYFKDALEIQRPVGNGVYRIDTERLGIYLDTHCYRQSIDENGSQILLWYPDYGYAKIITKKSPEYTITREQILELSKESSFTNATLNKWFPEVFETVFNTGYYKHKNGENPKWFSYANFETKEYYGSGVLGDWFQGNAEYHLKYITSNCEPMSAEEVTEALKKEAVKRGYKEGVHFKDLHTKSPGCVDVVKYYKDSEDLRSDGCCIFHKGQWAEIIQTKTKEEAEKLLNCKIID